MGLHVVAPLVKLRLLSQSRTAVSPFILYLICPFLIKLTFSLRSSSTPGGGGDGDGAHTVDLFHSSRLFLFQLTQIAFPDEPPSAAAATATNRWGRAVRLVFRSVATARRAPSATEEDEDSFHALSVFSL